MDRLNLIHAKRAVARPPNGLIRYLPLKGEDFTGFTGFTGWSWVSHRLRQGSQGWRRSLKYQLADGGYMVQTVFEEQAWVERGTA